MPKCFVCGTETELYVVWVPICLICDAKGVGFWTRILRDTGLPFALPERSA